MEIPSMNEKNHSLQMWYAEKHVRTQNMSNTEVNGIQEQNDFIASRS